VTVTGEATQVIFDKARGQSVMEDIRPQFEFNTDTKKKQDDTDIPYERQISKLDNSGTVQEESRL